MDIIEIGIDWLTYTLAKTSPNYAEWRGRCIDFHQHAVSSGNIPRDTRRLGYEGLSTMYTFVGEREIDGIMIITSSAARSGFGYLWFEDIHVSRLDLQVTVAGTGLLKEPGITARKDANKHNPAEGTIGHRSIHVHDEDPHGYTLYVGSRKSPYFGRFYDKWAQKPEEYKPGDWRYEVQCHNQVATALAEQLMLMNGSLDAAIASCVWHWWAERGVLPRFKLPDTYFTIDAPRAPINDLERKLNWLKTQVRPTIKLLWGLADHDILMEALGLPTEGRLDVPLEEQER